MNPNDPQSTRRLMTSLIDYSKALRLSIQNINENSYNNFKMRIGKFIFLSYCIKFVFNILILFIIY